MGKKKWKKTKYKKTYSNYSPTYKQCHSGNVLITKKPFPLYAAGGTRGMRVWRDSIVIDLADQVADNSVSFTNLSPPSSLNNDLGYSVIRIPWIDGGAPFELGIDFWSNLAKFLVEQNRTVIVCCMGGHGRTGTAIICLLRFLCSSIFNGADPVAWLRHKYCKEVVETHKQILYIEDITGMNVMCMPSWDWSAPIKSVHGSGASTQYTKTHNGTWEKTDYGLQVTYADEINDDIYCDSCGAWHRDCNCDLSDYCTDCGYTKKMCTCNSEWKPKDNEIVDYSKDADPADICLVCDSNSIDECHQCEVWKKFLGTDL